MPEAAPVRPTDPDQPDRQSTAPPAAPLRDASAAQPTLLDTRRRREARGESPFVARCRDVRVGNAGAKHVYLTTATWCDVFVTGDAGVCWPSLDTIRTATEYGRTAFMQHWRFLAELGLVVTKRGSGRKIVRTPDGALRPVEPAREVPESDTSRGERFGEKCRNPTPEKCRNPTHNMYRKQVASNALPGSTTPGAPAGGHRHGPATNAQRDLLASLGAAVDGPLTNADAHRRIQDVKAARQAKTAPVVEAAPVEAVPVEAVPEPPIEPADPAVVAAALAKMRATLGIVDRPKQTPTAPVGEVLELQDREDDPKRIAQARA